MRYIRSEFGWNRSIMKGTLLGGHMTIVCISLSTSHVIEIPQLSYDACATSDVSLVEICQLWRALYLEKIATSVCISWSHPDSLESVKNCRNNITKMGGYVWSRSRTSKLYSVHSNARSTFVNSHGASCFVRRPSLQVSRATICWGSS
jgi:hypothetical protein